MLFSQVGAWAPFKIDALGLATLLGADELNLMFGTLLRSQYLECVPTLSAYVAAGNYFAKPLPGFALYNVTDGIYATDVAAWLGRWLIVQEFTWNSSSVRIMVDSQTLGNRNLFSQSCSLFLGLTISAIVLFIAGVTKDWWGVANGIAMQMLGLTRWVTSEQYRASLDDAARAPWNDDALVKALCILPDGKAVTVYAQRSIVVGCALTNHMPSNKSIHKITMGLSWTSFGVHIIALGMAALINQLVAITLLVGSSLLIIYGVSFDFHRVGKYLVLESNHHKDHPDSRSETYVRLELSAEEEQSLEAWNLFPHRSNINWWRKYNNLVQRRQRPAGSLKIEDSEERRDQIHRSDGKGSINPSMHEGTVAE